MIYSKSYIVSKRCGRQCRVISRDKGGKGWGMAEMGDSDTRKWLSPKKNTTTQMAMMPERSRLSASNRSGRDGLSHQLMMTGHWHLSEIGDGGNMRG